MSTQLSIDTSVSQFSFLCVKSIPVLSLDCATIIVRQFWWLAYRLSPSPRLKALASGDVARRDYINCLTQA
jgi:hypothetical protein